MRSALLALLAAAPLHAADPVFRFDRATPEFDEIIPKDAQIEKLGGGFSWAEGPIWLPKTAERDAATIVFSDVPNNVVHKWTPGTGIGVFLKPSGYTSAQPRGGESGSNGLAVAPNGRLVLCQHGDRRVAELLPDGTFKTLADKFEGKRFSSPNDLCYHANGDLYFTDPPYGLEGGINSKKKEIPFNGVYHLSKAGKLSLVIKDLTFPNGVQLSPDDKVLYVAVSDGSKPVVMAYDVQEGGGVANGRVFFDTSKWRDMKLPGAPDGLKVDVKGNVFATGPGGVFVISPAGKYLGRIDPELTANCAFGDDGSTLYMTSNKTFCRVKTNTKGKGF
jgi:gluconolactonase